MPSESQVFRIVQFVNTLDVSDGGPARNSFELNLSLNARTDVQANLIWIRGEEESSVIVSHSSEFPSPGPRRLAPRPAPHRRQIGVLDAFREIRDADHVVVHGYFLPWIPVVAVIAWLTRTPLALMPHGALTARQSNYSRLKKATYERSVGWFVRRKLSTFVTGSESETSELNSRFPLISTATAGVGTTMHAPLAYSGLHTPLRLVSLARISQKKRIDLMIDSVAVLQAEGVDCTLTIAGVGPADITEGLRVQARDRGLEGVVRFIGQVDGPAKHALLWESDIFLLPSDDENFGIALAEALAHGLPCVASSNVAAAAAIRDSRGGRVSSAQTPESLAEGIRNLADSATFQLERTWAFATAEESFAWDEVARTWMGILKGSLRGTAT